MRHTIVDNSASTPNRARGFTLVDLLVSMAVIALLVAASLPSISRVQEAGRRTVSASNIRQAGLALQMYAYDRSGELPTSVFDASRYSHGAPEQMVYLRVAPGTLAKVGSARSSALRRDRWDGLGFLLQGEYLSQPDVFFNPSHAHLYTLDAQETLFDGDAGEIVSNYHYRMPGRNNRISALPPRTTLIADSMRSQPEYNHRVGNNMLKADMSITWFHDAQGVLFASLAEVEPTVASMNTTKARDAVKRGWDILDDTKVGRDAEAADDAHDALGALFGN